MQDIYTINLHVRASYSVLARIALVFSRRRLAIAELHMGEPNGHGVRRLSIDVSCDGATAERLVMQLRRVVEVVDLAIGVRDGEARGAAATA